MASHGIERVAVGRIYSDWDRNFRDPVLEYADCQPTPNFDETEYLKGNQKLGFFEDIYLNGVTTPVWVARLTLDQKSVVQAKTGMPYDFRTIRGHRRMYTVGLVNEKFPGRIEAIDCDVYTGLTLEQELELMTDHSPTKREQPLTELGLFRAVINLYGAGLSQEKIANLLGQKRGWSMRRIWLHQMGINTPLEKDFVASFDPKREKGTYVSVPMSKVDEFHKAHSEDTDAGRDPMDEGSKFREKYDSFRETGEPSKKETKSQTRKTILERASYVKGRPALEEAMKFASNDGGNLADAAKMYDNLQAKAASAESLASELGTVRAEVETLRAELASMTTEADTLRAELGTVRAEVDTLRAELNSKPSKMVAKK